MVLNQRKKLHEETRLATDLTFQLVEAQPDYRRVRLCKFFQLSHTKMSFTQFSEKTFTQSKSDGPGSSHPSLQHYRSHNLKL